MSINLGDLMIPPGLEDKPDRIGPRVDLTRFERHSFWAYLNAEHVIYQPLDRNPSCTKIYWLVMSGRDRTDKDGKTSVRLRSCSNRKLHVDGRYLSVPTFEIEEPPGRTIELFIIRQPDFVATPHTLHPTFLATQFRSTVIRAHEIGSPIIVDRSDNRHDSLLADMSIDVMTWDSGGSPAGNIEFSWVLTVMAAQQVFLGG